MRQKPKPREWLMRECWLIPQESEPNRLTLSVTRFRIIERCWTLRVQLALQQWQHCPYSIFCFPFSSAVSNFLFYAIHWYMLAFLLPAACFLRWYELLWVLLLVALGLDGVCVCVRGGGVALQWLLSTKQCWGQSSQVSRDARNQI